MPSLIYVHGIGNKPVVDRLKEEWDRALAGRAIAESAMAYWCDRKRYPKPLSFLANMPDRSGSSVVLPEDDVPLAETICDMTGDPGEQEVLRQIGSQMVGYGIAGTWAPKGRLRLPDQLRFPVVRSLTKVFLGDCYNFFFNKEERAHMQDCIEELLESAEEPITLVTHSQGSMIAYDALTRCQRPVELFVTMGSPLGIDRVQAILRRWYAGKLVVPPCVQTWLNVADLLDPIAIDKSLTGEFEGVIENRIVLNRDSPEHPHSATGYLETEPVREAVGLAMGWTAPEE